MGRRVFFSFHYKDDNWRASQVRSMGIVEGDPPLTDNDWEAVKRGGDPAIERWIKGQLSGKSCAVVLIGSETAGRKWIDYEITEAWNSQKGVLGIYIHRLKDRFGAQATKGENPFSGFTYGPLRTPLTNVVKTYDPPYWSSSDVYKYISQNIASWVEDAISVRNGIGR